MTKKRSVITIIGAGNVGATLGFIMALKNCADIRLFDIIPGVPEGKALDIAQSGAVLGFEVDVTGSSDYSILEGSDVVIVTAGFPRKPGMDRIDLLKKNAEIVASAANHIKSKAPNSIVIVVTNPVDVMTYYLWKLTGFAHSRVMGQAGVLDCARFGYFLSKELGISSNAPKSVILGGHGDSMVVLPRLTSVSGLPAGALVPEDKMKAIIERARKGGEEIVNLLKTGSAYFAPAAATALMAQAVVLDTKNVVICSSYLTGQYGINDVYIGVPARLGASGVEQVYETELAGTELEQFKKSAGIYKQAIKDLESLK